MADVLSDYLGGLNEDLIKDNFVIVYEVYHVPIEGEISFCAMKFLYVGHEMLILEFGFTGE